MSERSSCFFANLWLSAWALWDGPTKLGEFGWKVAPRFGFWLDLLTGFTLPFLFAGVFGAVGGFLGTAAALGSAGEAVLQLFLDQPYRRPISRMLIDWIPPA